MVSKGTTLLVQEDCTLGYSIHLSRGDTITVKEQEWNGSEVIRHYLSVKGRTQWFDSEVLMRLVRKGSVK